MSSVVRSEAMQRRLDERDRRRSWIQTAERILLGEGNKISSTVAESVSHRGTGQEFAERYP